MVRAGVRTPLFPTALLGTIYVPRSTAVIIVYTMTNLLRFFIEKFL